MGVLLFLIVPAAVVAVGWSILALRNRRPRSMGHSIDAFRREMEALSPDSPTRRRSR